MRMIILPLAGFAALAGSTAGVSQSEPCPIPPRDCSGSAAYCTTLLPFEPAAGSGYENYPINGETPQNQYRSYVRRDLMMLVKHASAVVACKARDWPDGNGHPIGLGDMSERNGAVPGTSIGRPGHPRHTHLKGRDMDIAYYQRTGPNNRLRAVCPHRNSAGANVHHCTGAPTALDVRRTALFVGTLLTSARTRKVGVDGRIRPLLEPEIRALCRAGTLEQSACDRLNDLAAETTDTGLGWFRHHHHHLHVSFLKINGTGVVAPAAGTDESIVPGGRPSRAELERLRKARIRGHVMESGRD